MYLVWTTGFCMPQSATRSQYWWLQLSVYFLTLCGWLLENSICSVKKCTVWTKYLMLCFQCLSDSSFNMSDLLTGLFCCDDESLYWMTARLYWHWNSNFSRTTLHHEVTWHVKRGGELFTYKMLMLNNVRMKTELIWLTGTNDGLILLCWWILTLNLLILEYQWVEEDPVSRSKMMCEKATYKVLTLDSNSTNGCCFSILVGGNQPVCSTVCWYHIINI
jgi:hypothetical protein